MPRGIGDIPDPSGGGGGDFIRRVKLADDKESCRIRFITDGDEVFWDFFHRIMKKGSFAGFEICVNEALGQVCDICDEGGEGAKKSKQVFLWVWELDHDYIEEPKGVECEEVKVGRRTVYRAEINDVRLMQYSTAHKSGINRQFDRLGTLLDHEFEWVRDGEKGTTRPTYMLEALEKNKASKEMHEAAESLPDLEDVALGKVQSLSDEEEEEEKPKRRSGRGDAGEGKRGAKRASEDEEGDGGDASPW